MEELLITEIEASTAHSLRKSAAANGRTVQEEAMMLIRSALAQSKVLTLRERADAISAMTPKGVVQTDSTLLIREDRDR